MNELTLGTVETRFAELVWDNAPLSSGELVKLCERELHWKKPTTYTVLRKLCGKGLFRNDGGTVTVILSREDFHAARTEQFVSDTWGGSLPAFVAAFLSRGTLSAGEAAEIRRMIEDYRADNITDYRANHDADRRADNITDYRANHDAGRRADNITDYRANYDAGRRADNVTDYRANHDAGRRADNADNVTNRRADKGKEGL